MSRSSSIHRQRDHKRQNASGIHRNYTGLRGTTAANEQVLNLQITRATVMSECREIALDN